MKKRIAIISTASILFLGALSAPRAAATLEQLPTHDLTSPPQLPRPVDSQVITIKGPAGFQLIGFTQELVDGIRGTLNATLACQREFPESRMCTADEVRLTLIVPPAPGKGYAWVEDSLSRDEASNCRGWISSSSVDSGTAIDLSARYGSRVSRHCDQPLSIACCAMVGS